MTKAASSPLITNALASGLGSLAMGGKPKDALRSALIGGIGGTALQEQDPERVMFLLMPPPLCHHN